MIRLKLPAEMACEEEGCECTLPVKLVLLGAGTLAATWAPGAAKDWQVGVPRNPGQPISTRCAKHQTIIQQVGAADAAKVKLGH
jgi:hypothetical protein